MALNCSNEICGLILVKTITDNGTQAEVEAAAFL